jgi:hypothetical protein
MGRPPKAKTNPEPEEINVVKNTDVQPEEVTIVVDAEKVVDIEKEELRKQVAEQQKQMEELVAQMKLMADMVSNKTAHVEKPNTDKRNITFINMVSGGMNLKGTRYYHIKDQFGTKTVTDSEARVILGNMPNAIQSGLVYITDMDFVEENGLGDYYNGLINDKTLKALLDKECDEVIEIYNEANAEQKKIILDMVVARRLNGERIDANIVVELGKLCNKNFMDIEPED